MKKILAMVLALVLTVSLVACAPAGNNESKPTETQGALVDSFKDPYAGIEDYDELSQKIYDDVLGEFYTAYEAAKAAENVSERQALMAIAEAKLLASGVMLPLSSNGGNYAISRVAPYTATSALWGNDSIRASRSDGYR